MISLAADLVQSSEPDPISGYRSFKLGKFTLERDDYFAKIFWPAKGDDARRGMGVFLRLGQFR
jgi:hypothetical protein